MDYSDLLELHLGTKNSKTRTETTDEGCDVPQTLGLARKGDMGLPMGRGVIQETLGRIQITRAKRKGVLGGAAPKLGADHTPTFLDGQ